MRVIGELSTDLAGIASEAEPVGMPPEFLTILQHMDSGDLHWHERLQNMLRWQDGSWMSIMDASLVQLSSKHLQISPGRALTSGARYLLAIEQACP